MVEIKAKKSDLQKVLLKELVNRELATRDILYFTKYTFPVYDITSIHKSYNAIINNFAQGNLKKLIVSFPPQSGKSEIATRRLPAYLLGINPDLQISIASYNQTFARKFSTQVQRIISDQLYYNIFPNTTLSRNKFAQDSDNYFIKTKDEFEIVNHKGLLKAVGRGGALTGNPVDIMIMDDLYKDYAEGNSPIVREAVIDWYTSVVRTRLHNDSQELIVFTRWHEEDLIGFLEKEEEVINLIKWDQLQNPKNDIWYKINFPAIATDECQDNEFDLRKPGEVIWQKKHSLHKLQKDRDLDEEKFESLYQGDPKPTKGLLYHGFNTYMKLPPAKRRLNYTDTADMGKDKLCSIDYIVGIDDMLYILDIVYTDKSMEETEKMVVDMWKRNNTKEAYIESNSGGRAFARNVDKLSGYKLTIYWFYQSENKESRIITNSAEVQRRVFMPYNWTGRFPEFSKDVLRFKKNFKANKFDDCADSLTGILEKSGVVYDTSSILWEA